MFPEGSLVSVFVDCDKLSSIMVFIGITYLSSLFSWKGCKSYFSLPIDTIDPHFYNTISESPWDLRAEYIGSRVC